MKADRGVKFDVDLTAADLKELAEQFKAEYKNQLGTDFPSDPVEQLKLAIEAVFRSWDNPRANVYRRDNDIPYSWGTAVNVMPMVFGNLNNQSGTGVAFTRDPATGENKLMGEFLINAQGEDVVQVFVHRCQSLRWKKNSLKLMLNLSRFVTLLKITTTICRIWSSLLKTRSSICFSAVTVREQLRLLLRLLVTS